MDGSTWNLSLGAVGYTLRGVWGSSIDDVWAVGDNGSIQHWNGTTWSKSTSGTMVPLRGVWGTNATSVWIVGDGKTILKMQ